MHASLMSFARTGDPGWDGYDTEVLAHRQRQLDVAYTEIPGYRD